MSEPTFRFELCRTTYGEKEDWEIGEEHPVFRGPAPEVWRALDGARIEIGWEGCCVAVAEARWLRLVWGDSSGGGDHDHYVALRLIERREHPIWQELPWCDLPVG